MRKCYAHTIGNCSGKLSREHLISRSILDEIVTLEGSKDIPSMSLNRDSITAKILCQKHNAELSPFDAEAAKIANALVMPRTGMRQGEVLRRRDQGEITYLNGLYLERWFAKTAINLTITMGRNVSYLSGILIPFLFQGAKFEYPYGLHGAIDNQSLEVASASRMRAAPLLLEPDQTLGGFAFELKGVVFLLWLPTVAPVVVMNAKLVGTNTFTEQLVGLSTMWHPEQFEIEAYSDDDAHTVKSLRISYAP